jgi:uncharacterized protein YjbI with pentapeptide repeats
MSICFCCFVRFAGEDEFPKANLSHAYLMGADFIHTRCQKADFISLNFKLINLNVNLFLLFC